MNYICLAEYTTDELKIELLSREARELEQKLERIRLLMDELSKRSVAAKEKANV